MREHRSTEKKKRKQAPCLRQTIYIVERTRERERERKNEYCSTKNV